MTGRSSGARVTRSMAFSRAFSASRLQQLSSAARGANGSGEISKLPDSIFDMSRMPLTTDNRCWPESLISWAYSLRRDGIDHQHVFLNDHLGKSDDGVERRAQFMAHGGEEAGLRRIRLLGGGARQIERLLLHLAVGDVAHHGDDLGFGRTAAFPTPVRAAGNAFRPR